MIEIFKKWLCRENCESKILLVFMSIFLIGNLLTLSSSPLPWMDEVQIIEMGRTTIGFHYINWSMVYLNDVGGSYLYYLGGSFMELFYLVLSDLGPFGPRLFLLFGVLLSGFLLYKYIIVKTKNRWLALGVSIACVYDPLLVMTARRGRLECWTFVFTCASLLLLSRLSESKSESKNDKLIFFIVGCLTTIQVFVWATSVLLIPLVAVEIFLIAKKRNFLLTKISPILIYGALGVVVSTLILLIPIYGRLEAVYQTFSIALGVATPGSSFFSGLMTLFKIFLKHSPALFILGVLGCFFCVKSKSKSYVFCFVVLVILICVTRVYPGRLFYVVPYLMIIMAMALSYLSGKSKLLKKLSVFAVLSLIVFNIGIFTFKNSLYFSLKKFRQHDDLVSTLHQEVGTDVPIYVNTFETYYAGRELGWKAFLVPNPAEIIFPEQTKSALTMTDYYISDSESPKELAIMTDCGYVFEKKIEVPMPSVKLDLLLDIAVKLGMSVDSFGYGPYYLYKKTTD